MAPTVELYCRRLIYTTITGSTLRNTGASGVVKAACEHLLELDLTPFAAAQTETDYIEVLDRCTEQLRLALPVPAQKFGIARKALNLYLGEAYYNQFVCKHYGLDRVVDFFEVPLDAMVGSFLIEQARLDAGYTDPMPEYWRSIKGLKREESDQYQAFAKHYAKGKGEGFYRLHIDLLAWRPPSEAAS